MNHTLFYFFIFFSWAIGDFTNGKESPSQGAKSQLVKSCWWGFDLNMGFHLYQLRKLIFSIAADKADGHLRSLLAGFRSVTWWLVWGLFVSGLSRFVVWVWLSTMGLCWWCGFVSGLVDCVLCVELFYLHVVWVWFGLLVLEQICDWVS